MRCLVVSSRQPSVVWRGLPERKPIRIVLVLLSLVSLTFSVPPAAGANLASPSCIADVPNTCSTTFLLPAQTVRPIADHANFHELLVDGNVFIEWHSGSQLIVRWSCLAPSVAGSDTLGLSCFSTQLSSTFSPGIQTMTVSADVRSHVCDGSCTFHARLRF